MANITPFPNSKRKRGTLTSTWFGLASLAALCCCSLVRSVEAQDYNVFTRTECVIALLQVDSDFTNTLTLKEYIDALVFLSPAPNCPDLSEEGIYTEESPYWLPFAELSCVCREFPVAVDDERCCVGGMPGEVGWEANLQDRTVLMPSFRYTQEYRHRLCARFDQALQDECTMAPSPVPTFLTVEEETMLPAQDPTTLAPSQVPTQLPTQTPTQTPTAVPSLQPTRALTTNTPTTSTPTATPTEPPTFLTKEEETTPSPTTRRTLQPIAQPSKSPSVTWFPTANIVEADETNAPTPLMQSEEDDEGNDDNNNDNNNDDEDVDNDSGARDVNGIDQDDDATPTPPGSSSSSSRMATDYPLALVAIIIAALCFCMALFLCVFHYRQSRDFRRGGRISTAGPSAKEQPAGLFFPESPYLLDPTENVEDDYDDEGLPLELPPTISRERDGLWIKTPRTSSSSSPPPPEPFLQLHQSPDGCVSVVESPTSSSSSSSKDLLPPLVPPGGSPSRMKELLESLELLNSDEESFQQMANLNMPQDEEEDRRSSASFASSTDIIFQDNEEPITTTIDQHPAGLFTSSFSSPTRRRRQQQQRPKSKPSSNEAWEEFYALALTGHRHKTSQMKAKSEQPDPQAEDEEAAVGVEGDGGYMI